MRSIILVCGIALCVLLAGCDSAQQWMAHFTNPEQTIEGQKYIDDVRTGSFGPVLSLIAPEYKTQISPTVLQEVRGVFPPLEPKSVKVVGWNSFSISGTTTYAATYEYEFRDRWILAQIVFRKIGAATAILGIRVQPVTDSLERTNAFGWTGKPAAQYAFLLITVAVALTTLVTAWFVWKTPIPRRKWLWMIFVLLGFGSLSLNWTTGAMGYQLLQVLLFGAAYTQPPYGPPILTVGFPLGALLFWLRRKRWYEPSSSEIEPFRHAGLG